MKKKKITAIMAVIMMAAGLSACSQSNAKIEGKSGIVKDEASKRESDTGTSDPIIYVQEPEYVDENDIISTDDTATIDGISYKIDSYEHTTEFGNRNKDTVTDFLKDSYEGNIDENYNLSNGYSYIFVTMTYTNNTDEQVEISRNAGAFYIINDDLERLQVGDPGGIYIDNYWTEGKENERYHYVLGAGESVTSEVGYIIQDEWISEDSKYIYYCIEGKDSKTNDTVKKYFKLEL